MSRPGVYSGYSPRLYQERIRSSVYITTRDGTRLAADIYRPAKDGKPIETPYPVIWEGLTVRGKMTPDGKANYFLMGPANAKSAMNYKELTDYGYVLVVVERRGFGASFGHARGYEDWTEAEDAFDVTEWLAKQSWSDGNIGVQGCSNTGEAAMHTMLLMPPHLKGVFAGCWNWDKYDGFLRGGILANWGSGPQINPIAADADSIPVDGDTDKHLMVQAIQQHRANTDFHAMWSGLPYRDSWFEPISSRFWIEGSTSTYQSFIERTQIPIYMWGGWNDDFRMQMFEAHASLHNTTKVLIGPWGHCQGTGFDFTAERLRYFDAVLKGVANGIFTEPAIYYYTVNAAPGKEWKQASTWPPERAQKTTLYLSNANQRGDGRLLSRPTQSTKQTAFSINTEVKCPPGYTGFSGSCLLEGQGSTYTTEPLPADLEVTGIPTVHLTLAANGKDANVFVYLEDVAPDKTAAVISDSRLRGSLRKLGTPPYRNFDLPWQRSYAVDSQPLTSGELFTLDTIFLPCSYVFKAGHMIRIRVTGYDPRISGPKPAEDASVLTVFTGSRNSSSIVLPTISSSRVP